ncbi:hypothetical protein L596_006267 [Steinernema carpocapsae]|uniref:Uncharacterized protein n=1 Tax=Steinernema carpocapsae TaxID=34508 RepID=A0A4U8V1M7_STECR|nr:hypothetical protein L596_006267 [Steinernema carpocapsae]
MKDKNIVLDKPGRDASCSPQEHTTTSGERAWSVLGEVERNTVEVGRVGWIVRISSSKLGLKPLQDGLHSYPRTVLQYAPNCVQNNFEAG